MLLRFVLVEQRVEKVHRSVVNAKLANYFVHIGQRLTSGQTQEQALRSHELGQLSNPTWKYESYLQRGDLIQQVKHSPDWKM